MRQFDGDDTTHKNIVSKGFFFLPAYTVVGLPVFGPQVRRSVNLDKGPGVLAMLRPVVKMSTAGQFSLADKRCDRPQESSIVGDDGVSGYTND